MKLPNSVLIETERITDQTKNENFFFARRKKFLEFDFTSKYIKKNIENRKKKICELQYRVNSR